MEYEVSFATQKDYNLVRLVNKVDDDPNKYHVIIQSSFIPESYSLLLDAYWKREGNGSTSVTIEGMTCFGYTDTCSYMYNLGMMTPESKKDWERYIDTLVKDTEKALCG